MSKPITAKIDVTKIDKELLFRAQSGAIYLDLVIWPNKDGGTGKYGDTHYIVQGASKEQRDAGKKGAIIGNLKMPADEQPTHRPAPPAKKPATAPRPPADPDLDAQPDDIPF